MVETLDPASSIPRRRSSLEDAMNVLDQDGFIKFTELTILETLGSGNFGRVVKADYLGTDVAVKEIYQLEEFDALKYYQREVRMLMEARHPNVLQYIGLSTHEGMMYIVTEYLSGGTLEDWINDGAKRHTWSQRISFAIDGARAVAYIHMKAITHRDLKTENFLLTENNRLKLTDFGLSRRTPSRSDDRVSYCGTDSYMAPELLMCMDFDDRVDVFSFGMVLLELIFQKTHSDANHLLDRDFRTLGLKEQDIQTNIPADCPRELSSLALRCCAVDQEERPRFKEIVSMLRKIEAELPADEASNVGLLKHLDSKGSTHAINAITIKTVTTVGHWPSSTPTPLHVVTDGQVYDVDQTKGLPTQNPSATARHHIPHRFSIINRQTRIAFLGEMITKKKICAKCKLDITTKKKAMKCDDCNIYTHLQCSGGMPASCQLSPGLEYFSIASGTQK
eukprot:CFRG1511T1